MASGIEPTNAIIVLTLLDEEPRSGYDIKQVVDERLDGIVEITTGTVYYTVKKLEQRGWLKGTVSRQGKRPERRVFRITAEGRKALVQLVEHCLTEPDRPYSPFDVALYVSPLIRPEKLIAAVDHRVEQLQKNRERLQHIEQKFPGRWPFHLYYLREKTKEIIDCNERWCQRLKRKMQDKVQGKNLLRV